MQLRNIIIADNSLSAIMGFLIIKNGVVTYGY